MLKFCLFLFLASACVCAIHIPKIAKNIILPSDSDKNVLTLPAVPCPIKVTFSVNGSLDDGDFTLKGYFERNGKYYRVKLNDDLEYVVRPDHEVDEYRVFFLEEGHCTVDDEVQYDALDFIENFETIIDNSFTYDKKSNGQFRGKDCTIYSDEDDVFLFYVDDDNRLIGLTIDSLFISEEFQFSFSNETPMSDFKFDAKNNGGCKDKVIYNDPNEDKYFLICGGYSLRVITGLLFMLSFFAAFLPIFN